MVLNRHSEDEGEGYLPTVVAGRRPLSFIGKVDQELENLLFGDTVRLTVPEMLD